MTNENRIDRVREVEDFYSTEVGPQSTEEFVIDLLTDLKHFCASQQISFTDVLATAQMHYEAEAEGGIKYDSSTSRPATK